MGFKYEGKSLNVLDVVLIDKNSLNGSDFLILLTDSDYIIKNMIVAIYIYTQKMCFI